VTSEVVVMNRLGIALASDSAATVYVGGRAKFYHADKLFMLSNHHPVGVMVYNNSSLLGVPWETILKMYRAELADKAFDTLEEYAADLIEYLNGNEHLFPEEVQRKHYLQLVRTLFHGIYKGIQRELLALICDGPDELKKALKKTQADVIQRSLAEWQSKEDVDPRCYDVGVATKMTNEASGEIYKMVADFFDGVERSEVNALYELARLVVSKAEILSESLSGLVIAGFGDREYFPVMQQYELGEIFVGRLKYNCAATFRIDSNTPSVVRPFAQSDMVETFLSGMSPSFELKLIRELVTVMLESPDAIIDGMPGVGKKRKEAYKEKVRPIAGEAIKAMVRNLRDYRTSKHLGPILQSIEFLPKNELAHVAASLVNLSSFQKRISITEDETVGGPIDVAVISKGDGFVWIERKHYFRPELNRHFFGENRPMGSKTKGSSANDETNEDQAGTR
jgi:hypothetical protein